MSGRRGASGEGRVFGALEPPNNRVETDLGAAISTPADRQNLLDARLAFVPRRLHSTFIRAWSGRSRKAAIRAFCLECMGYSAGEVALCTASACPLYAYRQG